MNMQEATQNFLDTADWLGGQEFEPLRELLTLLSLELDATFQTSLAAEYGRAYRHALSLKPDAVEDIDPFGALLN